MDARTAESPVTSKAANWLERERASGRFYDRVALLLAVFLVAMLSISVWILRRGADPGTVTTAPVIALLLIAILLPAIALMALYARKIAIQRAERGGLGSGQLHVRLVALFTAIAAVPTVLVAIFASLLFQSGLEFWFSDRARTMLENSVQVARVTYQREVDDVAAQTLAASGNVAEYLQQIPYDDPRFADAFGRLQVLNRRLSEGIIFTYAPDKHVRTLVLVNPYKRDLDKVITPEKMALLKTQEIVPINSSDRIGDVTRINFGPDTYLYMSRVFDPQLRDELTPEVLVLEVLLDHRQDAVGRECTRLARPADLFLGEQIVEIERGLQQSRHADPLVECFARGSAWRRPPFSVDSSYSAAILLDLGRERDIRLWERAALPIPFDCARTMPS